jgi:ABC-2 type transport system ATP-binding protein
MDMSVIEVEHLSRSFTRRRGNPAVPAWRRPFARPLVEIHEAVRDLSFGIAAGEKVAFIGPNGAGKSTTLKMLCGILHPTGGLARVAGFVPWQETRALASHLGIVFGQRSQLWQHVPVADSFDLLAAIYSLSPAAYQAQRERLVAMFGIGELLEQPARTLSLGQRMRCDIVASLLHQPEILFLDEPTIGLDVTAKALLRDHLNALAHADNTTIILTSHDTGDIESICSRVVLIDHGAKVLDTGLAELKRDYLGRKTIRLLAEEDRPELDLPGVQVLERTPHGLTLEVDARAQKLDQVIAACLARFQVKDLLIEDLPLEEVIKTIYAEQALVGAK